MNFTYTAIPSIDGMYGGPVSSIKIRSKLVSVLSESLYKIGSRGKELNHKHNYLLCQSENPK